MACWWQLLLLLLSLVSAQELDLRAVVRRNYNLAKVSGIWYSVSMASDNMTRIEQNGDLRVFIQKIETLEDGSLKFSFHFMLHGGCVEASVVCEKTAKSGEYTLAYEGDARVLLVETDYRLYTAFHFRGTGNGTQTQVLALYGRIPDLDVSFLNRFEKICRKYGLGPQNIINLNGQDECFRF